jgi:hypothetical protein
MKQCTHLNQIHDVTPNTNGCGGRSLSLSFRMESTTDGSRIPRLRNSLE